MTNIEIRPCAGEAELFDPRMTGEFAEEMKTVAAAVHNPPWCGYLAWQDGRPLGFGGFKGPPDPAGTVEFGYLTFPGSQGRGVATFVAKGLIEIAREAGARQVVAHTLPEVNASTRVLENAGLFRDGVGEDDDVGVVWRWALRLERT